MKRIILGIALGIIITFAASEAVADTSVVSYKWIEHKPNPAELSSELGVEVSKIQYGGIETGERYEVFKGIWLPVTKDGAQIWFDEYPTAAQLEKLDLIFSQQDLKREGGKGLVERIEELEDKMDILERSE